MTKYYVSSGNFRVVLSGKFKSPKEAAKEAVLRFYGEKTEAEPYIKVSEIGFDGHPDDVLYDTYKVLKYAGFQFDCE